MRHGPIDPEGRMKDLSCQDHHYYGRSGIFPRSLPGCLLRKMSYFLSYGMQSGSLYRLNLYIYYGDTSLQPSSHPVVYDNFRNRKY